MCMLLSAAAYSQSTIQTSSTADSPAMTGSEPNAVVKKALETTATAKSFRAHVVMTGLAGAAIKSDMEYAAPNRARMVASVVDTKDDSEILRFEAIMIGKDYYVNEDGKWSKPAKDVPDVATFSDPQKVEAMFRQTGAAEPKFSLVGPETINGSDTVEFEDPSFNFDGHRGALRVWIGTNDNLVRKVEVEIQGNLGDGSDKHTIAITYRDYNANIKIEPPM